MKRSPGSPHIAQVGLWSLLGLEPSVLKRSHPAIQTSVYLHAGTLVGYTRVHQNEPTHPRSFLARDAEATRAMVSTMARNYSPIVKTTAWA